MKTALYVCLCLLVLALAAGAAYTAFVTLPGVRSDTRVAYTDFLEGVRSDLAVTQEEAVGDLANTQAALVSTFDKRTAEIARSVSGTTKNANGLLESYAKIPDRLSPVIEQSVGTLAATTDVLQQYGKLPYKLGSTLDAATADLQDVQASLDDLYPDIKAGIETAIVAERSVAGAAGAIEKAAPVIADAAARNVPETLDNVRATSGNVRRLSGWPAVVGKVVKTIGKKLLFFL